MELAEDVYIAMEKTHRKKLLHRCLTEHKGLLFKVANSFCHHQSDIDDLLQEIAIQLWHAFENYRGDAKFSSWIYKVALFTAITWHRKQRRHDVFVEDVDVELLHQDQNEQQELKLLYALIRQLNEIDRSVTLLFLDGFSYQEIADILGISANNVGVKLSRIKQKLIQLKPE